MMFLRMMGRRPPIAEWQKIVDESRENLASRGYRSSPVARAPVAAIRSQGSVDVARQKYEELKPMDRAQLAKEDPQTFNALRSDWRARGEPPGYLARTGNPEATATERPSNGPGRRYEDLKPTEKARLARENPALFASMRRDWQARGEPPGYLARK